MNIEGIEEEKENLKKVRLAQKAAKSASLPDLQREYDRANLEMLAAQARLNAVMQKIREKIPASAATFRPGSRVWIVPLRMHGVVRKILGFSVCNGTIGALYDVESNRSETYHELMLREARDETKTG
jgi:hypothetical protein